MWTFCHYAFHERYLSYGTDVLTYYLYDQDSETNPMDYIFPKITSCDYKSFGYSGTQQIHNAQCLISLNILNEKVFLILWTYYVFLTLTMVYKFILAFLWFLVPWFTVFVTAKNFNINKKKAEILVSNMTKGDLYVLMKIRCNVCPLIFRDFIEHVINNERKNYGLKYEDTEDGLLEGNRIVREKVNEKIKKMVAHEKKLVENRRNGLNLI